MDHYPADWTPEQIREDIIRSGLNPEPTCWSDSGLNRGERFAMRLAAARFPNGAYARFVQLMDAGEAARNERTAP